MQWGLNLDAADVPMNCGGVGVQGVRRIILIYARWVVVTGGAVNVAGRRPVSGRGVLPLYGSPGDRATASFCSAGEMGCRGTCDSSCLRG
ncbi:hypothetical protein DPEC_G00152140 [Dallia pectoralis]|uniref:Uncharacterized protein n=1 Tax=Dallia pectoralis TaxID=75939 RepID=A0ACC2GJL1_DALPE|nr:hypothetical protein DPEC_G00152140 [Dallia pectoralis]